MWGDKQLIVGFRYFKVFQWYCVTERLDIYILQCYASKRLNLIYKVWTVGGVLHFRLSGLPEIATREKEGKSGGKTSFVAQANTKRGVVSNERSVIARFIQQYCCWLLVLSRQWTGRFPKLESPASGSLAKTLASVTAADTFIAISGIRQTQDCWRQQGSGFRFFFY